MRYTVDHDSGCWLWTGPAQGRSESHQYGYVYVGSKTMGVHRASHELFIGPIPPGWQVDHVAERGCMSTLCFNPEHLEAVPPKVNVERSARWPSIEDDQKIPVGQELGPAQRRCANGHVAEAGQACNACARNRNRRARQRHMDAAEHETM